MPVTFLRSAQGLTPNAGGHECNHATLADILHTSYPDDRHFVAYEAKLHRRHNRPAVVTGDAIEMQWFVLDADGPNHQRTEDWEKKFLSAVLKVPQRPSYIYLTKGGARVIWSIAPRVIDSDRAWEQWSADYKATLAWLESFGLVGDPACADPTRCYRAPDVVRDGVRTEPEVVAFPNASPLPMQVGVVAPTKPAVDITPGTFPEHVLDAAAGVLQMLPLDGEHNQRALILGGSLARWGLDDDAIRYIARKVWTGRCQKPESHVSEAVKSAQNTRAGQVTAGRGRLAEKVGSQVVDFLSRTLGGYQLVDTEDLIAKKPSGPLQDTDNLPYVLKDNAGWYHIRKPNKATYHITCTSQTLQAATQQDPDLWFTMNEKGGWSKQVIEAHAHQVTATKHTFLQADTTYDEGTRVLTKGLALADLTPAFDQDVDDYLTALAGPLKGDLERWIATLRPDKLAEVAAALILVGPKCIGKTALVASFARMWGAQPVDAVNVVSRFNAALTKCPIVFADEGLPKDMTPDIFRQVVTARDQEIEEKGKEKSHLSGALRFVVATNDPNVIRFSQSKNAASLSAVTDRLFYLQVPESRAEEISVALRRIHLPGSTLLDLDRMARHWLYLGQNRDAGGNDRFVGPSNTLEAREAVLEGEAENSADVWEVVEEYLEHQAEWESAYKPNISVVDLTQTGGASAKAACPIVRKGGILHIRPAALCWLVGEKSSKALQKMLRPYIKRTAAQRVAGGMLKLSELSTPNLPMHVRKLLADTPDHQNGAGSLQAREPLLP
jgi:hypothetical protein